MIGLCAISPGGAPGSAPAVGGELLDKRAAGEPPGSIRIGGLTWAAAHDLMAWLQVPHFEMVPAGSAAGGGVISGRCLQKGRCGDFCRCVSGGNLNGTVSVEAVSGGRGEGPQAGLVVSVGRGFLEDVVSSV